jgi:hypothetical protein
LFAFIKVAHKKQLFLTQQHQEIRHRPPRPQWLWHLFQNPKMLPEDSWVDSVTGDCLARLHGVENVYFGFGFNFSDYCIL